MILKASHRSASAATQSPNDYDSPLRAYLLHFHPYASTLKSSSTVCGGISAQELGQPLPQILHISAINIQAAPLRNF
jgi:hypothetical protein